MAEEPHRRRVRHAVDSFLERLRQPERFVQTIIFPKKRQRERVRLPLQIPDHRCALCGAEPISGVSLPVDTVVYFCERHLHLGRRIAERSWRSYKRRCKLEELLKAKMEYLNGRLDRANQQRHCPFCGQALCEEISQDGESTSFCPACDAEFYDTTGEVD